MEEPSGETLRRYTLLRLIGSTGTAVIIVTASSVLLCPLQDPFYADMCINVSKNIFSILAQSGMFPSAMGTIGGASFFFLSGKWIRN